MFWVVIAGGFRSLGVGTDYEKAEEFVKFRQTRGYGRSWRMYPTLLKAALSDAAFGGEALAT